MSDQTKPQWKPGPGRPAGLGTGVYGEGSTEVPRVSYVSAILYPDFERLMSQTATPLAYQWVPHSVASEADVRSANCGNLPCREDVGCAMPGCLCIGGICRRGP